MTSLQAFQLLVTAAKVDRKIRETYSRREIAKKMNEIKYLSAQKKIPRLTLRKEVLHLEHKVSRLLELEEKIAKQDSIKVEALKKEVAMLKRRLLATQDKDLHKKVEKLSHLLAACLTQKVVSREVKASSLSQLSKKKKLSQRARLLNAKIQALKQQLAILQQSGQGAPERAQQLQSQLQLWEEKLLLEDKDGSDVEESTSIRESTSLNEKEEVIDKVIDKVMDSESSVEPESENASSKFPPSSRHQLFLRPPAPGPKRKEDPVEPEVDLFPLPPAPKSKV